MKLRKRMILGASIIAGGLLAALLGLGLRIWLINLYGKEWETSLDIIFGTAGVILGFADFCFAFVIWTNNFSEGFKE